MLVESGVKREGEGGVWGGSSGDQSSLPDSRTCLPHLDIPTLLSPFLPPPVSLPHPSLPPTITPPPIPVPHRCPLSWSEESIDVLKIIYFGGIICKVKFDIYGNRSSKKNIKSFMETLFEI
ncbi:hypothetical protein E2C01_039582 [Portunus trituberculatus]|uniref:Uncharacterized protein n=1 Tax=Portunus trituberculatus TaxID=210409 RepID=A0A5B7FK55_PORTR|nr:hypothetical protein [Portunus trituberculatus]